MCTYDSISMCMCLYIQMAYCFAVRFLRVHNVCVDVVWGTGGCFAFAGTLGSSWVYVSLPINLVAVVNSNVFQQVHTGALHHVVQQYGTCMR